MRISGRKAFLAEEAIDKMEIIESFCNMTAHKETQKTTKANWN